MSSYAIWKPRPVFVTSTFTDMRAESEEPIECVSSRLRKLSEWRGMTEGMTWAPRANSGSGKRHPNADLAWRLRDQGREKLVARRAYT
jgi:hypothetical protein